MDPISLARVGMAAASARFAESAQRTARMGSDPSVDPTQEVVEQIDAKHQFTANLGVVKIADEMWRALMDLQTDKH